MGCSVIRRYGRSELERFLEEVDASLERPVEVVLIGAAEAILQYGLPGGTQDIDTWTSVRQDLGREDVPGLRQCLRDLELSRGYVIYPGRERYSLGEGVIALPAEPTLASPTDLARL